MKSLVYCSSVDSKLKKGEYRMKSSVKILCGVAAVAAAVQLRACRWQQRLQEVCWKTLQLDLLQFRFFKIKHFLF